jgi:hypothetical protein
LKDGGRTFPTGSAAAGPTACKATCLTEPEIIKMAKKRKRVAWSTEQVRTMKSMARKKSTAGKIAKAVKRTEGATRQKAFSIGLSLDSRGR